MEGAPRATNRGAGDAFLGIEALGFGGVPWSDLEAMGRKWILLSQKFQRMNLGKSMINEIPRDHRQLIIDVHTSAPFTLNDLPSISIVDRLISRTQGEMADLYLRPVVADGSAVQLWRLRFNHWGRDAQNAFEFAVTQILKIQSEAWGGWTVQEVRVEHRKDPVVPPKWDEPDPVKP